ncbi:Reverse transcriptase zinc-binding domain [Arabidopsis suecica]|uniref:Reverse transcriptase zinc-binding domain n=1 Tax=Arabidopsis suecica TaxID=45249 RepID=A0A8T1ZRM8_ARASU|nr:Reverse transcriptase zinc-binding domain [Arabidopsis suecica]
MFPPPRLRLHLLLSTLLWVVCETASFWHDNWTGLGPLIHVTGANGPLTVGLPLNAVVRDALRGRDWWLASSRSRNQIIALLKSSLPDPESMIDCMHDDVYMWKADHHAPSNTFSAAKTWIALHPNGIPVPWHSSVWFKDRVPKHAFICWVVAWNRLHTRDRLRSWGLNTPSVCVLCNGADETHDLLFFQCHFSGQVWSFFTRRAGLTPPPQLMASLLWLKTASTSKNISLIIKLLFQASVYLIWRERNLRIHSSNFRNPPQIIKEIQLLVRARLDPLSRSQSTAPLGSSLLVTWFALFQD